MRDLAKTSAYNQYGRQIGKRAKVLRCLLILSIVTTIYKVSSQSRSEISLASISTRTSPSSSGWLEHVVSLQKSEHFKPLRMQSHVFLAHDFLQVHALSSFTALGAGRLSIQSILSLSPCTYTENTFMLSYLTSPS